MVLRPVPKTLLRVGVPKNSLGGVCVSPMALPRWLVGPRLLPREGGFAPSPLQCGLVRATPGPLAHPGLGDIPEQRWKIRCFLLMAGLRDRGGR